MHLVPRGTHLTFGENKAKTKNWENVCEDICESTFPHTVLSGTLEPYGSAYTYSLSTHFTGNGVYCLQCHFVVGLSHQTFFGPPVPK